MIFLLIVFAATMGISALAFVLLRKVFPLYRRAAFSYGFWGVNFLAMAGVAFGRGRLDTLPFSAALVEWVVVWFMAQVFAIFLLPVYFVARKGLECRWRRSAAAADPERRKLLRAVALSLPAAAIGIGAYGTFYGSREIRLLRYDVPLARLAPELAGLKIAQISDAHIGLFFSADKLREVLERLLAQQPDMLAITGDLIDDLDQLPAVVEILNAYAGKFPRGVYFSWGNHEYFRDFPAIDRALRSSRVRVLRNESALLAASSPPLYVVGVDYPWAKGAEAQRAEGAGMLREGLAEVPDDAVKILLSHHPALIDDAAAQRVALTLTGHTHGGQVAFFGQAILPVRYKYMRGMYRHAAGWGYVSVGAGSWFPFRLGCPAEIAVFRLLPEKSAP